MRKFDIHIADDGNTVFAQQRLRKHVRIMININFDLAVRQVLMFKSQGVYYRPPNESAINLAVCKSSENCAAGLT